MRTQFGRAGPPRRRPCGDGGRGAAACTAVRPEGTSIRCAGGGRRFPLLLRAALAWPVRLRRSWLVVVGAKSPPDAGSVGGCARGGNRRCRGSEHRGVSPQLPKMSDTGISGAPHAPTIPSHTKPHPPLC
eukprot:gene32239-21132_t